MATEAQLAHLRVHNPIIAKIPRGPRKHDSAMQSRYANAIRWAKARGEYDESWNQSAYRAGYQAGVTFALAWSELQPKRKP